ncbi:C-type lectin domain family 4 member E-like [Echeneis naucrates]|uniref:C-type lectin domain family 4 member E-like n=1 Tax=Echeneis naucrates TaxID=173247 RepID=UPI001113F459|nr:C-type lectin domain family 4 member E-like [Echeneis naucrates]
MWMARLGSRKLPAYPLAIGCLALLNAILLLTAVVIGIYCEKVSKESSPQDATTEVLFVEANQLRVINHNALTAQEEAERELKQVLGKSQQVKQQLQQNKTHSDNLQKKFETLLVEKATLQSSSSDLMENCGQCPQGWFLLNATCYFHGKLPNNPLRSWMDSRADCVKRGAELVVTDTLQKMISLSEHLPKLKPGGHGTRYLGIWIGLTDRQTEGTWVWVNNVTLQGPGYWSPMEPNNSGVEGEDCVGLLNRDNPRMSWYDANCNYKMEWLCEKALVSSS